MVDSSRILDPSGSSHSSATSLRPYPGGTVYVTCDCTHVLELELRSEAVVGVPDLRDFLESWVDYEWDESRVVIVPSSDVADNQVVAELCARFRAHGIDAKIEPWATIRQEVLKRWPIQWLKVKGVGRK